MKRPPVNGDLVRVVPATPEEVSGLAEFVGARRRFVGEKVVGVYFVVARDLAQSAGAAPKEEGAIVARGRLRYLPGFKDVWVGDTHYDLRERRKAQLCLEFLVESEAFDADSAQHLVDDIDPYVRRHGDFPRASEIKLDDYFNDRDGKLRELRKELVVSAGRDGRYFLRVE